MRPQKFRYLVNMAIQHRMKTGSSEKFTKPLIMRMIREWYKMAKCENDYRRGSETYGYKDQESIDYNILYISDRWNCAFRLKWLIDGVADGLI